MLSGSNPYMLTECLASEPIHGHGKPSAMTGTHKAINIDLLISSGELERQHGAVDRLVERADALCQWPDSAECPCSAADRQACAAAFDDILSDALIFLVEHFCYEEGLMKLFSADPLSRDHIERHKEAHGYLSAELTAIVMNLRFCALKASLQRFGRLFGTYIDDHHRCDDVTLNEWLAGKVPAKGGA